MREGVQKLRASIREPEGSVPSLCEGLHDCVRAGLWAEPDQSAMLPVFVGSVGRARTYDHPINSRELYR